mmetsp:Transcript_1320/g.2200  ORF Transcript_1320/g.2200 Transcript_1320/m.2200 type:complete len:95 (-) Transcript_1320:81-365(-)|eukprot:CAMPEP_0184308892 /NCGR_PEP_ID=MMETSP1049-20130417/17223_1 /TAXON_ID=77928 /ORGANISM="Proteomonas sulcata, Strain CCMP704" /LENGTH=94 /DNA_ID=CAMNT_0026621667 /DNA_START=341 /DNA_END=625 /DNA_ORIENTATION=+
MKFFNQDQAAHGKAADGLSTMLFASGFGNNQGQWWTVGSAGGPAGTTSHSSLSWWNHGNTTNDWQSQLAAAAKWSDKGVSKSSNAQAWPRGVAL